ncbi:putative carbohydrate-binding module family 18 protein [Rosellinia necatrix]|uniref:Putative carbohydrate-binding module family 18 protein n=1 Tax=Rosellinia necatrix TaxID=77044 RepID=A0A1S8ABW8_ROSNE|nr:putative carbohydrate-binding module family 18 protein [Rosellinia necatrix]
MIFAIHITSQQVMLGLSQGITPVISIGNSASPSHARSTRSGTIDELAARYSNSTHTITTIQFLSWNANIQGSCSRVAIAQRVCKSAPGGTFANLAATIAAPVGAAGGSPTFYAAAAGDGGGSRSRSHSADTRDGLSGDCTS